MKKIFLSVLLFGTYFFVNGQDSTLNFGFEKWEFTGQYEKPLFWETVNYTVASIPGITEFPVAKTTGSFSGKFAVRLKNVEYPMIGMTVPGVITNGRFYLKPDFTPVFKGGQPINFRPDAVTGRYKYLPTGKDSMGINVFLTKHNVQTGETDTIASGGFIRSTEVKEFVEFSMDLTYRSSLIPDTILIIITSSILTSPLPGGELLIDELNLETSSGIKPVNGEENEFIYPTFFSSTLYPGGTEKAVISIYDLNGRPLVNREMILPGGLDVSYLKAGVYFYRLQTPAGMGIKTGKLVKAQ